ncbi:MAG: FkbM family methyltransferase [Desulfuromonadaceae bacterium]
MPLFTRFIQRNKALYSYLISHLTGSYKFTRNDLSLYLNERFNIQRPSINVFAQNDQELTLLEIGGRRIFWPSAMAYDDLSWLFGEVFSPWSGNPSSYNHPDMEIGKAEWVMDAGACEGFFSLFAFEQGARRVVVVEPLELLCSALRKTFSEHIDAGRFQLIEGALGQTSGIVQLNLDPLHACDASVASSNTGISVPCVTLDELGELYHLAKGGIIKMDIEGAEMDALTGAGRLLREYKPKLVVSVYHEYDNANLCAGIIRDANPAYKIEFRGMYDWFSPPRPYMLIAR